MSDFLNKMLQNSIDREAKKIVSSGATEEDRYGHLLDSVKNRDLNQEEKDRYNEKISQLRQSGSDRAKERERDYKEHTVNLNRIINDVESRDRREADEFLTKHKKYLDMAQETIHRERSKTYFS